MAYRYKTIKVAGCTVLVHRHVMEKYLGRTLTRSEHVHHINGDRYDNRLSNLVLMTSAAHQHHHKQKYPTTKRCGVCGARFTPHPTKRKRAKTCSSRCAGTMRATSIKASWPARRAAAALVRANVDDKHVVEVA